MDVSMWHVRLNLFRPASSVQSLGWQLDIRGMPPGKCILATETAIGCHSWPSSGLRSILQACEVPRNWWWTWEWCPAHQRSSSSKRHNSFRLVFVCVSLYVSHHPVFLRQQRQLTKMRKMYQNVMNVNELYNKFNGASIGTFFEENELHWSGGATCSVRSFTSVHVIKKILVPLSLLGGNHFFHSLSCLLHAPPLL